MLFYTTRATVRIYDLQWFYSLRQGRKVTSSRHNEQTAPFAARRPHRADRAFLFCIGPKVLTLVFNCEHAPINKLTEEVRIEPVL